MTTHQIRSSPAGRAAEAHGGFLRLILKLDAVATGAVGVLALAAGPVLDDLLGAPLALLWPVGLFLAVYAVAIWIVATRSRVSRPAVWAAVVLNLAWTADCIVVVAAGWFPLTGLGIAFVLAQAAVVALFAGLQFVGLRRTRNLPAAR